MLEAVLFCPDCCNTKLKQRKRAFTRFVQTEAGQLLQQTPHLQHWQGTNAKHTKVQSNLIFCLCFPHSLMHSESSFFSANSLAPLSLHSQTMVLLRHMLHVSISSLETLSFFLTLLAPAATPLFVLSERWIHMPCGCFINCKQAPRRGPSGKQFTGKAEGGKSTLRVIK